MEQTAGGVTAAKGFMAAGVAAGVKYKDRKDMALIYSERPCMVAGVFTSNVVKAAPVLWDREIVSAGRDVHGVIVNAGIANACTGAQGYDYCRRTAAAAAAALGVSEDSILVASTGVIGMQLPMDKIVTGVSYLADLKAASIEAGDDAAHAIMTTDTVAKQVAVTVTLGGRTVTIGGMCKGSGMIHPNMCTMLGFVTTDVCMTKELLQEALSGDVQDTFNMISVDGDRQGIRLFPAGAKIMQFSVRLFTLSMRHWPRKWPVMGREPRRCLRQRSSMRRAKKRPVYWRSL